MNLALYRSVLTPQSTIGKLFADGKFFCFTLELPVKDGLPGSAIPTGIYPVEFEPSPKFQALAAQDSWFKPYADAMPHVICPPRTLIMLHPGNYPSNTDGCILVGETQGIDCIGTSRPAFAKLYPLIADALRTPSDAAQAPPTSLQPPYARCTIAVHDPPADPPLSADPMGVDEASQM